MSEHRLAFERLFRAHHTAVYRYVMRRVEEPAVQDVVAETFLIAWRRQEEIAGDPLPWLLGVARRLCANHLRGRERRAALGQRLAAQPSEPSPPVTPALDLGLKRALASLADRDREALLLIAWDELSNPEAAKVMGCSPAAFAVRVHRARRRLARMLAVHHEKQSANTPGVEGMATRDVH